MTDLSSKIDSNKKKSERAAGGISETVTVWDARANMNSPGDDVSSLKKKLQQAKLQDEKYESDTRTAVTAELFRRVSQEVVSIAVTNVIDKLGRSTHK